MIDNTLYESRYFLIQIDCLSFQGFVNSNFITFPQQINSSYLLHGNMRIVFWICPIATKTDAFILQPFPIFTMFT